MGTDSMDCSIDKELQDYADPEKQRAYDDLGKRFPGNLHYYNADLMMPNVRGKVILDVPCGNGYYTRKYFKQNAAKVIASDIVPLQIEEAKKKDKEAGIPEGFAEYYIHDARVPKQLSATLADLCTSIHFFCFAENEDQIRGMVRMLNVNLKPGGFCVIAFCPHSNNDDKYCKALESTGERLVHLDPPSTEELKPRRIHTTSSGFRFERYLWRHDVVRNILEQEGFSRTEIISYKFDSSLGNPEEIQHYIDDTNRKMILAWKD